MTSESDRGSSDDRRRQFVAALLAKQPGEPRKLKSRIPSRPFRRDDRRQG